MTTSTQIRPSSQVRKDFLDFFKSKQHTIVPSSSLLPDSPNLLFTNAGMNQFVPIFLGQTKCPYTPGRAADTQKCIRAGGKHNDLEDVGLDTYHHTFFEMLGNWCFGDYFKKEAIEWAWELVVDKWKFPATGFTPRFISPAPANRREFDQEAYDIWAEIVQSRRPRSQGHIVTGGKKDNFWMMGDTGPCGPCSEIHVDLTPAGDTKGALVNKGDARCIEIWNLVFIQFNANPDGTFSPLPARHVDTGMGFERVTSIIQGTKGFTDFANAKISNYETDIFRPIFDELEKLSGKKYGSTLLERRRLAGRLSTLNPATLNSPLTSPSASLPTTSARCALPLPTASSPATTTATTSCAASCAAPCATAARSASTNRSSTNSWTCSPTPWATSSPKSAPGRRHVQEVIRTEEEAFNKTLDRGIEFFEGLGGECTSSVLAARNSQVVSQYLHGQWAFKLYDTYGFPLDLTELMARERGHDRGQRSVLRRSMDDAARPRPRGAEEGSHFAFANRDHHAHEVCRLRETGDAGQGARKSSV